MTDYVESAPLKDKARRMIETWHACLTHAPFLFEGPSMQKDLAAVAESYLDLLAESGKLLALMHELPAEPGGQQDRVFAEFEFDGLRAAVAKAG